MKARRNQILSHNHHPRLSLAGREQGSAPCHHLEEVWSGGGQEAETASWGMTSAWLIVDDTARRRSVNGFVFKIFTRCGVLSLVTRLHYLHLTTGHVSHVRQVTCSKVQQLSPLCLHIWNLQTVDCSRKQFVIKISSQINALQTFLKVLKIFGCRTNLHEICNSLSLYPSHYLPIRIFVNQIKLGC